MIEQLLTISEGLEAGVALAVLVGAAEADVEAVAEAEVEVEAEGRGTGIGTGGAALNILFGAESGGAAAAAASQEEEGIENAAKGTAEEAGHTAENEEGAAEAEA